MISPADLAKATIAAVAAALADPLRGTDLQKATTTQGFSTATGVVAYNLEAPAKNLYPVLTPLRNVIARQGGGTGTAVNWKAITGINAGKLKPGVAEGAIGTVLSVTEADYVASYRTLGFPNTITFEAIQAARGFDDPRAMMTIQTLQSAMIGEEVVLLGGNYTAIAKPGTITAADSNTAGSLVAVTAYDFAVSCLTTFGYVNGATGRGTSDSPDETDGNTLTTYTTGGGKTSCDLTWSAVRGAVAYNVFVASHGGTYYYSQTVTVPAAHVSALPVSGNTKNTANQTADTTLFDGIIQQLTVSTSGAYWKDLANAAFTGDNAGGVTEIDVALKSMWDNFRLGPDELLCNSQEAKNITAKILANGSTTTFRVNLQAAANGLIQGGLYVDSYLNKYVPAKPIKIIVHPNLAPGTVILRTNGLPEWYPNANVPAPWVVDVRQDWTQYDFAQTDRQYRIGVYVSEVLKSYLPGGNAVITGIKDG